MFDTMGKRGKERQGRRRRLRENQEKRGTRN
jgi:hypothetical protein